MPKPRQMKRRSWRLERENVRVWADAQRSPLSGANSPLLHRKTESQRESLREWAVSHPGLWRSLSRVRASWPSPGNPWRRKPRGCFWEPNPLANDCHKESCKASFPEPELRTPTKPGRCWHSPRTHTTPLLITTGDIFVVSEPFPKARNENNRTN